MKKRKKEILLHVPGRVQLCPSSLG
jgi:hypothetical protein